MKKIIGLGSVLLALAIGVNAWAAAFTAGNIVVYRMGDGATSEILTNVGTAVYLDEYQTNGTFVQTIKMPTNYFGANYPLIGSGTPSGDGLMSLSQDGRFLVVPGYGARLGGGSSALSGISATTVPRVYATVDGNAQINTTTAQTNSFSNAENPRSGTSTDGTNLWISGDANGLRYTTRGSSTATQLSTFITNLRQVNVYSNVLCFSDQSGVSIRIGTITNAMPVTTSGAWMATLPGVTTDTNSPYGFVLLKLTGGADPFDTLYYASDGLPANGFIYKYSLVGGTWTLNGSFAASNVRGLTGRADSSGNVHLYMTTAPAAPSSGEYTGGGYLIGYTDSTGYNAAPSNNGGDIADFNDFLLATPIRKVLRGVAFVPQGGETFPDGPGQISVGPLAGFTSSGLVGGSFGTKDYSIANFGTTTVGWSVSADTNWVSFTPSSGSLSSGGSITVTVSMNANATSLPAGTYTTTMTFTNTTSALGTQTRPVTLIISDQSITPSSDFVASGPPGGPFAPANKAYTLSNGVNAISWTASPSANYFTVTPSSGALGSFASTIVTVAVNTAVVNPLPAGNYSATISFSNSTANTLIDTRAATVLDGSSFWFDDFSTYSSGDIVGQNGWLQLGTTTADPLQVTGGALVYKGGLVVAGQTAYKDFPLLSNKTVFVGMRMTVTGPVSTNGASGVNSGPPYITTVYQNNSGTINGGFPNYRFNALSPTGGQTGGQSNFVFGARPNGQAAAPWQFTTNAPSPAGPFATSTVVNVILVTDANGSNATVYVNPTSPILASNTVNLVNGPIAAGYTQIPSVGSFGLSQFGTAVTPSAGSKFFRIAVSTNYVDVYNFITTGSTNVAPPSLTPFQTWQVAYFGSTNSANSLPSADPDGDGMINNNEFLAGFNPTNSAAFLTVISVANVGSDVKVTYLGANGDGLLAPGPKTNVLESSPGNSPSGSYSNNFVSTGQTNILNGGSGLGVITNMVDASGATNRPSRYYRVRVLAP